MAQARVRSRALVLTMAALALVGVGVATRRQPARADCSPTTSSRLKLAKVTEDGVVAPISAYDGTVLLFSREPGVVEIAARPAASTSTLWRETYRVAPAAP